MENPRFSKLPFNCKFEGYFFLIYEFAYRNLLIAVYMTLNMKHLVTYFTAF